MTDQPTSREFLIGSALALVTMTIWAGWNIVSRLGVGDALAAADIVFLRFAVAGVLALPFLFRFIPFYRQQRWYYLLGMIMGAGAPYVYLASLGFERAPASHGVLTPGAMLLWVAVISALWLKESFNRLRVVGYTMIAATVGYRLISHSAGDLTYLLADGWFLAASLLWAAYTVINKKTGITPLAALALVSVGSSVGFCVPYLLVYGDGVTQLPLQPAITQMLYQGVIVSFVALMCFNKAIVLIGPSRASAYAAAIPILTAILSMVILGEYPLPNDWAFIALLTTGVLFATGVMRRLVSRN